MRIGTHYHVYQADPSTNRLHWTRESAEIDSAGSVPDANSAVVVECDGTTYCAAWQLRQAAQATDTAWQAYMAAEERLHAAQSNAITMRDRYLRASNAEARVRAAAAGQAIGDGGGRTT